MRCRVFILLLGLFAREALAAAPVLPQARYRSGEATLQAFAPISAATRQSIVKLNVDGETVALGTVVSSGGLALTKASELKRGKLTCWLASEREVDAQVLATDEEEDVALVRLNARGLRPIQWAVGDPAIGQWAVTPGIADTPQAVGIISALPRRINFPRALIGVQFETEGTRARIESVVPGLGADKAGLKRGDVIVGVNQTEVTNREQVVEAVREMREGQKVKLRIQRRETQFTVDISLMVPRAGELTGEPMPPRRFRRITGQVSDRAEGFETVIEHDTVLFPWMCGGPLVNLDGKAVGLNIARASRVSTYALPARLASRCLERLKSQTAPAPASLTQPKKPGA